MSATVLTFATTDPEPQLPQYLAAGRTTAAWEHDWQAWDARQVKPLSVRELAQAIDGAPKIADAPFALTAPASRARTGRQESLF
jgi:hypothetical protein